MRPFRHVHANHLPSGWSAGHFGDLADFRIGRTPPRADKKYWDDGIHPWISIADMTPFGTVSDTKERVSEIAYREIFRGALVPAGSLLMSFKLTIGRMARCGLPTFHNEAIISFLPKAPDDVNPDYLFYCLGQIDYGLYQDTAVKGKTLNKAKIESIEVALPPPDEQGRISSALATAQSTVSARQAVIDRITELRDGLREHLFTKTSAWTLRDLGVCCDIVSGSMTYQDFVKQLDASGPDLVECMAMKVSDMNLPGNEREMRSANVTRRLARGLAEKKLVPPGCVVLPKRGAAIATNKKRLTTTWTALDPNLIALRPGVEVEPTYLFHWLLTFDLRAITDPGPTPQLNKKDLEPVQIPLPSTQDEQRAIVSVLATVDERLDAEVRRRSLLEELFQNLLTGLMSAELRVPAVSELPDVEPASMRAA